MEWRSVRGPGRPEAVGLGPNGEPGRQRVAAWAGGPKGGQGPASGGRPGGRPTKRLMTLRVARRGEEAAGYSVPIKQGVKEL